MYKNNKLESMVSVGTSTIGDNPLGKEIAWKYLCVNDRNFLERKKTMELQ
jgi:hypothetical protein